MAALVQSDSRHAECRAFMSGLRGRRLLPGPVLTEVCWLLERWPRTEAALLEQVADGAFELVHPSAADLKRMAALVRQYSDFPLGSVDASVIAVAERFAADRVATIDRRHFSVVKPRHLATLTLLP